MPFRYNYKLNQLPVKMGKNSALIGIAGAHFVAAELSQKGYVATVTSRNTDGIDLLASSPDGSKTVSIQVKTSTAKYYTRSWIMSKKQENTFSKNLFYVFVDLNDKGKLPDFYIIPSKIVADYIKKTHTKWLRTPGKGGKKHKDTDMRLFEIYEDNEANKYLNKWENLGLG